MAQAYREGVETLRKAELKRLKDELPEAPFNEIKNVGWPLRKRLQDLDPEKDAALFKLFGLSPALHQAYILRESLTEVFELASSKTQGRQAILRWCEQVRASGLDCFEAFLGTVDKWLDEITNYFVHGDTSGFVEGLNNNIKVTLLNITPPSPTNKPHPASATPDAAGTHTSPARSPKLAALSFTLPGDK